LKGRKTVGFGFLEKNLAICVQITATPELFSFEKRKNFGKKKIMQG